MTSRFTFEEVFGVNSYQDSNQIVINKSDLSIGGIIKGEQLLIILLGRCLVNGRLTVVNQDLLVNGEPLEYDNSLAHERLNVLFTRNQLRPGYFVQILKIKIFLFSEFLNLNEL